MKASDFIKKFGWYSAENYADHGVNINDLKRYVDAYELVHKDFESVEMADYEHMVSDCYSDPYWIKLKQAITLVEECQ